MDLTPDQRVTVPMSDSPRAQVAYAVEAYLVWLTERNYSPRTVESYGVTLRRFARDIGQMQVRNLRPDHVTEWFYGPHGKTQPHADGRWGHSRSGISASTQNTYRAVLKAFFDWCRRRNMTRRDLMEDIRVQKVPTTKRQQPRPEILVGFLDSARHPRDRGYLALSMNTALRASEITRLRVGQVDLASGTLTKVLRSKTGAEDNMPITSDLDVELRRWLTYYFEVAEVTEESYLFPTLSRNFIERWEDGKPVHRPAVPVPGRQWTAQTHLVVQRGLAAVGLPTNKEGTHTIRRAVARAYFDRLTEETGYESAVRVVGSLLGHQRAQTTEVYLGINAEQERRDKGLRGQPFLSAMQPSQDNVVSLRDRMLGG